MTVAMQTNRRLMNRNTFLDKIVVLTSESGHVSFSWYYIYKVSRRLSWLQKKKKISLVFKQGNKMCLKFVCATV